MKKLDKKTGKIYIDKIKELAKANGYKKIGDTIYRTIGDNIVDVVMIVVKPNRLVFRIGIKKGSFDYIFWDIMDMEDNKNAPFSLRINGAYTSPKLTIDDGYVEITDDAEMFSRVFLTEIENKISHFIEQNDVIDYVIKNNGFYREDTLKCLAYLEIDNIDDAKQIALNHVKAGDVGDYISEGKGFYERLLTQYDGK